jgi:hypothetical protein
VSFGEILGEGSIAEIWDSAQLDNKIPGLSDLVAQENALAQDTQHKQVWIRSTSCSVATLEAVAVDWTRLQVCANSHDD